MTRKPFLSQLLYGGFLAIFLSYLIADYYSTSLLGFYHDWTGWRRITGHSPNKITGALTQISWALVFCMSWWMLWRLDRFIISVKSQSTGRTHSQAEKKTPPPVNADTSFDADSKKSENFKPEEESSAWTDDVDSKKSEKAQDKDSANEPFFNSENSDAEMAEVLGLGKDQTTDFSQIKQTYRRAIAQYHPDKVSALGPEIREVAENKAKEINHAYEYFRKKFQKS